MVKKIVYCLLILLSLNLHSQTLMNKDSLLLLLPAAQADTVAVQLFINIGQQYESNEPEIAKTFYRKAGLLSEKLAYPQGIIQYINNYTFILNQQGKYDSSLLLNLKAVELAEQIYDSVNLAKTLINTGTSYRQLEDFENAVRYYEKGKKIIEKFGDEFIEAQVGDILQVLYYQLKDYNRAIEYGEKSVKTFRNINDPIWLGYALTNLGLSYSITGNYNKALSHFNEALAISRKTMDKNTESTQYLNIGDVYLLKGEYAKIKSYMEKALVLSRQIDIPESEAIALKGLSLYYTYWKDYEKARQYADSALKIGVEYNFKGLRAKVYSQLSNIAYACHNMPLGEHYSKLSGQLADSILNEEVIKNTQKLEKLYEVNKKETEIHHLKTENELKALSIKQKRYINLVLMGGIFWVSLASFLVYRNQKHLHKIQQQRIQELETEKQLEATEAVLKGETQERTRLAKDLHDGLGGMLSGIKHSFTAVKENLIMAPENQQVFERSMDMLDSSIKEMRRVAHNMMPETLVRFGLDTALKDFCHDISQSGALKVNYQSINIDSLTIDQTISITIYRIVQELLNNTMKHAKATSAIVQLNKSNNILSVTVEDDGNGFDTAILQDKKGIGWDNIRNRVEFLKGTLDISSKEGEGTSVQIEFSV